MKAVRISLNKQLLILICFIFLILILMNLIYLTVFNTITEKRSKTYFSTIFQILDARVNAIVDSIEITTQSLAYNKTMQLYLADNSEQPATEPFVQNLLMETILFSSKAGTGEVFDAIYLMKKDRLITAGKYNLENLFQQIWQDYTLDTKVYYSSFYTRIYLDEASREHYYAIIQPLRMAVNADSDIAPSVGYCIYLCNAGLTQDLLFFTELPDNAQLYLYDYDNHIVAASDKNSIGKFLPSLLDIDASLSSLSSTMQPISSHSKTYLSKMTKIDSADWSLLLLIPYADLSAELRQMLRGSIIFGTVSLLLTAIFVAAIINSNIRQVQSIMNGLQLVESIDAHHRLDHCGVREFNTIATGINKMLEQLETTTQESIDAKERLFTNEMLKKNAEMYALQSQVNPHFLYNTLECIRSIAQHYNVQEIANMTSSIASIFRYCIQSDEFIPLAEEMKCVWEYLSIMETRFPNKFHVSIDVPARFHNFKILKMILQPIVENAINHGLCKVFRKGELSITAQLKSEKFLLIIRDNGAGIAPEDYKALCDMLECSDCLRDGYRRKRIGLANINARLKITYGDQYGLRLISEPNKGTCVILEMPPMAYNTMHEGDKRNEQM